MLSAISYDQKGYCNISMILGNAEFCALHVNERVSGLIVSQSQQKIVFKDSSLQVREQEENFRFNGIGKIDIGISEKIKANIAEQRVSEGCETYEGRAAKVSMTTLLRLGTDSGELIILTGVARILADERGLQRESEPELIGGLFEGITNAERKVVEKILNP